MACTETGRRLLQRIYFLLVVLLQRLRRDQLIVGRLSAQRDQLGSQPSPNHLVYRNMRMDNDDLMWDPSVTEPKDDPFWRTVVPRAVDYGSEARSLARSTQFCRRRAISRR